MAWKVEFKKDTLKFLSRQNQDIQEQIRHSINTLLDYLNKNIIPFHILDIKRLKGKREGFIRLRRGRIRIVLKLDTSLQIVRVYAIDYRGDIYKG